MSMRSASSGTIAFVRNVGSARPGPGFERTFSASFFTYGYCAGYGSSGR